MISTESIYKSKQCAANQTHSHFDEDEIAPRITQCTRHMTMTRCSCDAFVCHPKSIFYIGFVYTKCTFITFCVTSFKFYHTDISMMFSIKSDLFYDYFTVCQCKWQDFFSLLLTLHSVWTIWCRRAYFKVFKWCKTWQKCRLNYFLPQQILSNQIAFN